MVEQSNVAPDGQTLHQGLADLRQTWEHLARELASGVPELPGVIEQELAGLTFPDLNEETLIRVTESVVARVADAGFPTEATALFRRMGRAMYELLLLLATQAEIREMVAAAPAVVSAKPPPGPPAPLVVAATPEADPPASPTLAVVPSPELTAPPVENLIAFPNAPEVREIAAKPAPPPAVAASSRPRPPQPEVAETLAQNVETVTLFEPRDPVRPARGRTGMVPGSVSAPKSAATSGSGAPTARPTRADPSPKADRAAPAPGPATRPAPTPASKVASPAAPQASAPSAPIPPAARAPQPSAAQPPPAPGAVASQPPPVPSLPPEPKAQEASPTVLPAGPAPVHGAAPAAPPRAPTEPPHPVPSPAPRELTQDEAPLWGFDPAARESGFPEDSSEPPVPEPTPPVPATVGGAPPSTVAGAVAEARPEPALRSGWTVRLSPRSSTEHERKLAARQAQLPLLVAEIVAAATTQQAALSARGNARRALAAARDKLPLADGADLTSAIESMLEAGQLEEAASMAVQMANTVGGEAAAGVACTVGEGVKQSKHVELAVLCFTTAVLCCPPCDRACWQLCTLTVERRDTVMAPVWLEFVARLLRVRGADTDSISVYRQLLKLTPRRSDIRELVRISSLTGVLPD
ncbi:MAG TPA: hypothetical protein VNF24_10210 [Candidatus Acidoferrales bacterium]|nr:hypothetical protein [Candidatus Acidoferrales bacterium]